MAGGQKVVVWRWLARGKLNQQWRELSWHMTEEQAGAWAKSEGRDIQKVEGSAEERSRIDQGGHSRYPATPGWKP